MKWCEVVGTEPYLCLNFGTGTLADGKYCRFPLRNLLHVSNRTSARMAGVLQLDPGHLLRQSPPEEWT
jgi:alpha-L-arabinofuranosidase